MGLIDRVAKIPLRATDSPARMVRRIRGRTLEESVGGRNVMITGASSGIGLASARQIAEAGANVLLVARTREKLEALRDDIAGAGGTAAVHPCDLTDLDDIDRMAAEVLDTHGSVDVLVNNAGRSIRRSVRLSYDRMHDYQRTMQLNYFGPVKLILALLPSMVERQRGHIVNISSTGVQTNVPRFSAYVASKAALDAFSAVVGVELHDDKVRFTTVYMPLVRTPMIAPTGIYKNFPALSPDEAADLVAEAIRTRPKRLGTRMGTAFELAHAVNPGTVDAVANSAYHLFPDSRAARGDERERERGESDEISERGRLFARVLRGPHW